MTKYTEQFWRTAKPVDVSRDPELKARFRNASIDDEWRYGSTVIGYDRKNQVWISSDNRTPYILCEVYDEPDWHKNKPEPGEGYRLLEKFPEPEQVDDSDQFFELAKWNDVFKVGKTGQVASVWYRRKIEPAAVQEAKAEPIMAEFEVAAPADSKIGECVMHCVGDEEALGAAIVDPGEGFRLIHAGEETPMAGDEFYSLQENCWKPRKDHNAPFNMLGCYRRKEEPVKERVRFVAHPIQHGNGEWLFNGKVVENRSYAVLNENGHYLQWVEGNVPEFNEKFFQAFTPGQLRKVSAGLLQGIRLRAVEPVDVDKLRQEIRQELQPRPVEQNRQVSYQNTGGCYQLPGDAVIEPNDRYVSEDGSVWGPTLASVGELVSSKAEPYYRPVLNFTPKRGWEFKGEKLEHVAYAVVNAGGKFLQCDDKHGIGFTDRLRQTWTPSALVNLNMLVLAECKLVQVQPVHVDPFKQKLGGPDVGYATGKVYEHNGRKFRLAVKGEEGYAVFGSNIGLPDALQGVARRLISVRSDGFKPYQLGTGLHFQYAFVEIDEPTPLEQKAGWEPERQKVRLGGKEYWVLARFQPVTKNGHEPREHVVLQEVVWTNAAFKFAFADSLDDAESEPQPQQPEYVPFEWQDRYLLKNRYIRRDEDPDRERLILEIVRWMDGTVEVKCRDKSICVSELLRDYVFDDGTPCGKRVEQ